MNKIINKLLLVGEKCSPEMQLKQPGFMYSAYEPFIKNKERIQKFKKGRSSWYIYQNELHKACFQNDLAYGDFKKLPKRTAFGKALCDIAFNIAENL